MPTLPYSLHPMDTILASTTYIHTDRERSQASIYILMHTTHTCLAASLQQLTLQWVRDWVAKLARPIQLPAKSKYPSPLPFSLAPPMQEPS
jgi:hypothetical protein